MRVHVAFTPGEAARVPTGVVVDVLRATSTITQALDAGYAAVFCCAEVEEARALAAELGDAVLAGERRGDSVPDFDLGNSPREFLAARARAVVLTTTNGTRALVEAAANCDVVLAGSLLNLSAVAEAARIRGEDVEIVCAGVGGNCSDDDAYCAGRLVQALEGERTDAAVAAAFLADAFPDPLDGINARTYGPPGLEEDIAFCARASVLEVVPRLAGMRGPAAEITL